MQLLGEVKGKIFIARTPFGLGLQAKKFEAKINTHIDLKTGSKRQKFT